MKNSTTRKIIEWVTRLLKYYPPMKIPYQKKECKIHLISVRTESRVVDTSLMKPYLLRELSIKLEKFVVFNDEKLTQETKIYTAELEVIKRQIK